MAIACWALGTQRAEPSAGLRRVLNELFLQEPASAPAAGSLPTRKAASPSVSLRTCWAPDLGSSWSTTCCPRPGTCPTPGR